MTIESNTASSNRTNTRTYGNWRKPQSAGLFGLGSLGTAFLLGAMIFTVVVVMVAGLLRGVIVAAGLLVVFLALVTRDAHGASLVSRISTRIGWSATRAQGQHLYRSGPLGRALWGTYQLPGIAAATRLSEHTDSYGRPFAMVYTPATASYGVVIATEPDGAALVNQEQVDLWVAQWGHWLANLGDEAGVEAAAVTLETAPDSGARLRREVELNTDPQAPAFARQMLGEVVQRYPAGSSTVKAYVTITFSATTRTGGKRRDADELGRDLASRLPGLTAGLQATGAGAARPMGAQELCETIRVAYDPAAAGLIDEAHALGQTPDLGWPDVGPTAHETSWDGYRHDGAFSCTWSMTGAPRGHVQSNVLARLLAPHRDIARKRITLLYRPIDPARAAAIVESDVNAAQFRMSGTAKPAARDVVAVRAAQATAAEEASGAGLVNFGVLITATVTDRTKAADARAAIDSLSATARLRIRPVYGSQDSAFAAALPLGLVLSKHLKVPAELKDKL
ncbi:SCO6880 family protein [Microlunatus endophyticus]|uniref:SCO6880 family protein n=1 Tax=Microlunatus endophyticus TaxID=1716077 RepID=UPI001E31620E|nr:SCO6880 family protein [Microlunatus endophyticus]